MKVSAFPQLTGEEKKELKEWLVTTLQRGCTNENAFPVDEKIGVYVNGGIRVVARGIWGLRANILYLAHEDNPDIPHLEKVGMLVAIASAAGLADDVEILDAASTAFAGGVQKKFNETFLGVIQSKQPILGLAVSPDGLKMACQIGDDWKTIRGEIISEEEVTGWLQIQ